MKLAKKITTAAALAAALLASFDVFFGLFKKSRSAGGCPTQQLS